jgi:glucosamine--fructose-6-phosphate aminotransferase (isomerizing)
MCGIVAAVADRNILPVLLEGLRKLEYRGYDSAGLALINENGLHRLRAVGRVAELAAQVDGSPQAAGNTGIAHTRWATHGVPCERNAHPHVSDGLAVVHNGIIENHEFLRARLKAVGYQFTSDTDTEVMAHLIAYELRTVDDFLTAVRQAIAQLQGAYAIAVLREIDPSRIVVAREGSPLLLGLSDDGCYAASDASALIQVTRRMVYLENGDCAELRQDGYRIVRVDGTPVERPENESHLSADAVELGQYRHYMQKEIFEQPNALANTLEMIGAARSIQPGLFGAAGEATLKEVRQVLIIACGTSYHAGLVARYWLESIAAIPCTVEVASEYRYRESVPDPETLVVTISQSGETADTLAALQHAKALGMPRTLCICNVPESSLVRENTLRFITRAGPEIGVASTKAFTTQLAALYLLTLVLAKLRGRLDEAAETAELHAVRHLPVAVSKILELEPAIRQWSEHFSAKQHALFLGRGRHYPIAMEGALKMKEISYIYASGHPSAELKHGIIALVKPDLPSVFIAPDDAVFDKNVSNIEEVKARKGPVIAGTTEGCTDLERIADDVLYVPPCKSILTPLLTVIPLQLLSYYVALARGCDVDKPRNLAKSVTVE